MHIPTITRRLPPRHRLEQLTPQQSTVVTGGFEAIQKAPLTVNQHVLQQINRYWQAEVLDALGGLPPVGPINSVSNDISNGF
jgi:hypothetical protein